MKPERGKQRRPIKVKIHPGSDKTMRGSQKLDRKAFRHQTSSKKREVRNLTHHPAAATKMFRLIPSRMRKDKLQHSS